MLVVELGACLGFVPSVAANQAPTPPMRAYELRLTVLKSGSPEVGYSGSPEVGDVGRIAHDPADEQLAIVVRDPVDGGLGDTARYTHRKHLDSGGI